MAHVLIDLGPSPIPLIGRIKKRVFPFFLSTFPCLRALRNSPFAALNHALIPSNPLGRRNA